MNEQEWDVVNGLVIESAERLGESLGREVHHVRSSLEESDETDAPIATIGFGGHQLRGVLLVVVSEKLLRETVPRQAEEPPADAVDDWAGELSNLVLGRLKSRLLAHGVAIVMSTPTTFRGRGMRASSPLRRPESLTHTFEAGGEVLTVRLSARESPGVRLKPANPAADEIPDGDFLLFDG